MTHPEVEVRVARSPAYKDADGAPPGWVGAALATVIFVVGVLFGATLVTGWGTGPHQSPTMLSGAELAATGDHVAVVPSMDVLVHFVSVAELTRECHTDDARVVACSRWGVSPCEVFLPAGHRVAFFPHIEMALWDDGADSMDEMLVHELLHCVHPNWHQPFTDELAREDAVALRGSR